MTQKEIKYIIGLRAQGKTSTEIRKVIGAMFNVKKTRRNEIYHQIFANVDKPLADQVQTFDEPIAKISHISEFSSLEDVLAELKIDRSQWQVASFSVETRPQKDAKDKFSFKINLKKNVESENNQAFLILKEDLKSYSPFVAKIHSKSVDNNDLMLELSLADVHLGRLCWKESDGDNYNLKIARDLVFEAVHDMAEKAKRFGKYAKVLLWIGGDYLNVDNEENTTTALTRQSVDSRFPKVFKEGKDILIEVINYLKEIAPVDVMITRGNHDLNSMFHMGEVVEAYFHNDSNVSVNNSPAPRKYYRFGQNLIQFCHGHEVPLKSLPTIFAAEAAADWGQTKFHECHTAHRHNESLMVSSVANCKIRVMDTITGADTYHATHGYVKNTRCAQSFIWSRKHGLQSLVYSKSIEG